MKNDRIGAILTEWLTTTPDRSKNRSFQRAILMIAFFALPINGGNLTHAESEVRA